METPAQCPELATAKTPWDRMLAALLAVHVVVWTLVPLLTQPNLPLDTIEMLYWGREWQLGYVKHPVLPAWSLDLVARAMPGAVWGLYLVPQLAVALTLWAVWRLARQVVSPQAAFLVALSLECCAYFNFCATEMNNNVGAYPCWALAALFLYWAITTGRNRHWLAAGACLGLGMLAKYSVAVLGLVMLGFLLIEPEARKTWRRPGPYLMALAALAVFGPHLYWAYCHHFPSLTYAAERTGGTGGMADHLLAAPRFAAAQMVVLLPMFLALTPLTGFPWRMRRLEPSERFARNFLVAMAAGPVLICLVLSAVFGLRLRSMHGSHLLPHVGLLLVFLVQLRGQRQHWRSASKLCVALASALVVIAVARNVAAPFVQHKGSRINFPGAQLAQEVERLWRDRYGQPLPVVAGEWWLAGNASYYSPDRPSVYGGLSSDEPLMSKRYSDWMSDEEFTSRGGVILWTMKADNDELPEPLRSRFPCAEQIEPLALAWQTRADLPPVRIGVAVIAPESQRLQAMRQAEPRVIRR